MAGDLAETLLAFPVVVLTGMRQTGKTTLLKHEEALSGRAYVTLDDFGTLDAARRDPDGLLASSPALTIDEVQRAPGLLSAIKGMVDRNRRPGRFLLSGSANLSLMGAVSESLAGRAATFELGPMTRRELRGTVRETPRLAELLGGRAPSDLDWPGETVTGVEVLCGGMPEVALGHPQPARWFESFAATYVERDLRQLSQVADLTAFRRLLQMAALRTSQVLNESSLARDAALPVTTVRRYLGLMETAYVCSRLAPFLANQTSRLIKSPKLYVSDSGLAAALAGADDLSPRSDEPMRGALLETYVLQNLRVLLSRMVPRASLSFWNASGRNEVDFIIEWKRRRIGIEVKDASRWSSNDLRGLRAWQSSTPGGGLGLLAVNCRTAAPLGPDLWAVPLGDLLG